MFGQMKSSRRSNDQPSKPCPCGGTCYCHQPIPGWSSLEISLLIIAFVCLIMVVFILVFGRNNEPQHIQVDGKDCIVHHVNDHCTSTGACRGHDEAICPLEK